MTTAVTGSSGNNGSAETDLPISLVYKELCERTTIVMTKHIILVEVKEQRLHLVEEGRLLVSYPISTAKNGIGQKEGSGKTPLGLHVVCEKIGDGAAAFEIFSSRENTHKIASIADATSSIVGRILRLKGLEEGHNLGKNTEGALVDSFERYIYIHGTNYIDQIGQPLSSGCVRMIPEDIIALHDKIDVGTLVYIYA